MTAKYEIGSKVVITPVRNQTSSPRDVSLEPYTGKTGTVSNYYWISKPRGGEVFYLYTVLIESDRKEVVLHEDELESCPG